MDTLRTRNLVLDAVTAADTQRVLEYCQDPVLQGFVPVPVPYTMEAATGYTQSYATDARYGRSASTWMAHCSASSSSRRRNSRRPSSASGSGRITEVAAS